MKLATAAQMRETDRKAIEEWGIPSIELMERAAAGLAGAALEWLSPKPSRCRVAVFCGAGNNGGDGIAAARLLHFEGVTVRVFLVGNYEKLTPDALEETRRLSEAGLELERFEAEDASLRRWVMRADLVIDAVFGFGLSREISEDSVCASAIKLMNESPARVIAADIASGVETDTGRILGCAVKADKTITFTEKKVGQAVGDGYLRSGDVVVHDIGIPEAVRKEICGHAQTVEVDFVREAVPARRPDGHKGNFGKLLIVGGAVGYTGAPYLTASAAVRSGCGLVYLGVPKSIWEIEAVKCASAMPFPLEAEDGKLCPGALTGIQQKLNGCDVLALGPGLGRGEGVSELVSRLLETEKPVVLDADGLNALEKHMDVLDARRGRVTVLTPHDGEFIRLGGDLPAGDRVGAARKFAAEHGCVLVLKGHRTITATPQGTILVNTTGNSGLAKGGSGDVLTGLIASLMAQGATEVQAAAAAVWMHGRCGDLAAERLTPYAMTPEDVISMLPKVFRELKYICN